MNIVSVSRRTDIPALYGDWFINRVKEDYAEYVNPFYPVNKYKVSLKPDDVICFVLWSKDFKPFMKHFDYLDERGYNLIFHYTITGYPEIYEANIPKLKKSLETFKKISKRYSTKQIQWRYDTILFTSDLNKEFHLDNFKKIASSLEGYTERCYFSFINLYSKVKKRVKDLILLDEHTKESEKELANDLADVSLKHGIQLTSCCGDYLISSKIKKGSCIDGDLVKELFNPEDYKPKPQPTRKECNCVESKDIGRYDTCIHGCLYCYANGDITTSREYYKIHDYKSSLL